MPPSVARHARAFTLVELIMVLLVATCLIGLYVRALNDADIFAMGLQNRRVFTIEQKAVLRLRLHSEADDAALGESAPADPYPGIGAGDAQEIESEQKLHEAADAHKP